MSKIIKLGIALVMIATFLVSSDAFAFKFLYQEGGKEYYETDSGEVISKEISKVKKTIEFIYQEGNIEYFRTFDGKILIAEHMGGNLSSAPDYEWWYGCSPTSAGMMMGYYNINGYGGQNYSNLVPGGTAELSNYGNPSAIANSTIASSGHIGDYYVAYGDIGNDPHPDGTHTFNCLADFMGTSQDNCSNSDGSTTFWYWAGRAYTAEDAVTYGVTNRSGMYGIGEYVTYAGYSYVSGSLYNQYIDPFKSGQFSWEGYKAEIDAGRPTLIHITGHTMFGYGYSGTSTVYLHDTWTEASHTMTWGGTYDGKTHRSVTCVTLSGGGGTTTATTTTTTSSTTTTTTLPPCQGCPGDVVVLQNLTLSSTCKCVATTSITVGPNVTIEDTADVTFTAPTVILKPEVKAESGSKLQINQ